MKIAVCVRQGLDGEINPFDACAYEAALSVDNAEITLISMAPPSAKDFLLSLTRRGAKNAWLLSDSAFSGSDTLATAYVLSLAIKRLKPDLVFCGRQTLVGDTAQTPAMLSRLVGFSLVTEVMGVNGISDKIECSTRSCPLQAVTLPAVVTFERINTLRLPRLTSKMGELEILNAAALCAAPSKCGLNGSPTRVIKTFENTSGRRKCTFLAPDKLLDTVKKLSAEDKVQSSAGKSEFNLKGVFCITEAPLDYAKTVSDDITVLPLMSAEKIAELIIKEKPNAVLWASDFQSKQTAAHTAALLSLGLCADCTRLDTDGKKLIMYRPALSGSIIACVESLTLPAMATVRTVKTAADTVVCVGYGAKDDIEAVRRFAESINADVATSRKCVDNGLMPYSNQVGLTGKSVSPRLYIALGISGAVHHIVGMEKSGKVIAVNPDRDAPIFDYADFGFVCTASQILNNL